MRIRYLFFIISFLILLSCSDQDEIEENNPVPDEQTSELTALRPQDFDLTSNASDGGIMMILDKYCWETEEEGCNLTPTEPEEYLSETRYIEVNADENISLTTSRSSHIQTIDPSFYPDELTIIQTTAFTGEQQEIEVNDMQFTPIKGEGLIHYYTLIAKWDII